MLGQMWSLVFVKNVLPDMEVWTRSIPSLMSRSSWLSPYCQRQRTPEPESLYLQHIARNGQEQRRLVLGDLRQNLPRLGLFERPRQVNKSDSSRPISVTVWRKKSLEPSETAMTSLNGAAIGEKSGGRSRAGIGETLKYGPQRGGLPDNHAHVARRISHRVDAVLPCPDNPVGKAN